MMPTKKVNKYLEDDMVRPWDCPVCRHHKQFMDDIAIMNSVVLRTSEIMRYRFSGYSETDADEVGQAWVRLLKKLGAYEQ